MTSQTDDQGKRGPLAASVIVPTYRPTQFLADAIESFLMQRFEADFEVIVVDNGLSGEVREYVETLAGAAAVPVRYIAEPHAGLHNARHAGARAARGHILVYVDDDVVAPQGWLEAICARYREPLVACVGGKTVPKWEVEPPKWLVPLTGARLSTLSILDLGEEPRDMRPGESPYGCNFSVRRRALFEVGGFNPDGFGRIDGPEWSGILYLRGDGECGLVEKLFQRGRRVLYEPRAWLYHRVPARKMTPRYFCRRSFLGGITGGYSRFRSRPVGVCRLLLRAGWHSALCLCHSIRSLWRRVGTPRYVRARMALCYRKGAALHALRLCRSRALRQHVLKDCYLE